MPYQVNKFDRRAIKRVLRDGGWHTFGEISEKTNLSINQVMDVTGHYPYDIIGTRLGYKLIDKATDDEIDEARGYLHHKIYAMRTRSEAFKAHQNGTF